jgi:site-specific DNA-cytosine methylase
MPARSFGHDGGIDERFARREVCDALHQSSGSGNKAPVIAFDATNQSHAQVAHTLRAGSGRAGHESTPIAFTAKDHGADAGLISPTLRAGGHTDSHANGGVMPAVAFHPTQDPISSTDGSTHAIGCGSAGGQATVAAQIGMSVRRLTPTECERLQGFPDDWTLIPGDHRPRKAEDRGETVLYLMDHGFAQAEAEALADCPDGPRYKAIGNSMAVPVMRWIGEGIAHADRPQVIDVDFS